MRMDFVFALLGGALLGVSTVLLFAVRGRLAGISGVLFGLNQEDPEGRAWRGFFLLGLVGAGALLRLLAPGAFGAPAVHGATALAAGLLVGAGSYLANGCTSGHGICGLGRRSPRSLASVGAFLSVGVLTATAVGALGRGL